MLAQESPQFLFDFSFNYVSKLLDALEISADNFLMTLLLCQKETGHSIPSPGHEQFLYDFWFNYALKLLNALHINSDSFLMTFL